MTSAARGEQVDQVLHDAMDRAVAGDRDAFGVVYRRTRPAVYRFVYFRVHDPGLAEDLAQETYARALRRIDTFQWQGQPPEAWLITIARNLVADHFKSSRVRLERPTAEMLDPDEVADPPDVEVFAAIASAELRAAVARLSPAQQWCVHLRFLADLTVAETAAVMNKNEGAVKTMQYRATQTLARNFPELARSAP